MGGGNFPLLVIGAPEAARAAEKGADGAPEALLGLLATNGVVAEERHAFVFLIPVLG